MEDNKAETISIRVFVTARTQELCALSSRAIAKAGAGPSGSSTYVPFKHIPNNLRRRAVSHNVKRLPFRFRPSTKPGQSSSPSNKGNPLSFISNKKKTKSSRKHKRRKSNLLLEFNRRQLKNKWMETHIWHAKRFHVENKWNYKIPILPCDKGQRALYRSTKNYATMQDVSFISPLQLTGTFDDLCAGFQLIAPRPVNTLSIGAVMYSDGEREGQLHIYKQDSYPRGYIGCISFMWLKRQGISSSSSLWLWVHPAFKQEIIDQLLQAFDLQPQLKFKSPLNKYQDLSVVDSEAPSIDEIKLKPKNLSEKPSWSNPSSTITMTDLEGELNRIKFSGPLILDVFKEALRPTRPESLILKGQTQSEDGNKEKCFWFHNFQLFQSQLKNTDNDSVTEPSSREEKQSNSNYLTAQQVLWDLLETIEDFPSYTILPLIVRDPRVFLPKSRTKVLLNGSEESEDGNANETLMDVDGDKDIDEAKVDTVQKDCVGTRELLGKFIKSASFPLYNPAIRSNLIKEKMTDQEFCDRRGDLLIPGSEIDLGGDENQIPVILVHRPASENAKSYSDGGFDLILPAGWTMAFWIAFAYRATRVAGLRDSINVAFSTGNLHSPAFPPPDSLSGVLEASNNEQSNRENYFKFSPAKRPNLIKLNCASPFYPPWESLLDFWNEREKEQESEKSADSEMAVETPLPLTNPPTPFILRDKKLLYYFSQNVKSKFWAKLVQNLSSMENIGSCLIGVRIDIVGGGRAENNSIICLPTLSDVELIKSRSSVKNVSSQPIHEEPPMDDDELHRKRTELKEKHEKVLSFLRKKRKRCRRQNKTLPYKFEPDDPNGEEVKSKNEALLKHYDSTLLSSVYNEQMRQLWLPPQSGEGVKQCLKTQSRTPIGFVVHGDDEYSRGLCSGLGYISASALLQFARNAQANKNLGSFVLVRNWSNSLVYRSAKLQVLLI